MWLKKVENDIVLILKKELQKTIQLQCVPCHITSSAAAAVAFTKQAGWVERRGIWNSKNGRERYR